MADSRRPTTTPRPAGKPTVSSDYKLWERRLGEKGGEDFARCTERKGGGSK